MNDIYQANIIRLKTSIQAMQKRPLRNYFRIKRKQVELQALEEGQADVLGTSITNRGATTQAVVNKNNYRTYDSQVLGAYRMYNAEADYGVELCKAIVDFRSAIIAGEGISYNTTNKAKEKWIKDFIEFNKLSGSGIMHMVRTGELEGKCTILLKNRKDIFTKETKIGTSIFAYYLEKYKVNYNKNDYDIIDSITYNTKADFSKTETINMKEAVYIKLGGLHTRSTKKTYSTSNRLHSILTDIENFSRAKYDLRENTHLFGKYTPYWHTATAAEAKAINNDLQGDQTWKPGTGYAGSAEFNLVEPTGGAADAITKDMLISLKNVSFAMGMPIHYMSWPELMSNRATAETLHEVLIVSTKIERLLWEEGLKELIFKAMEKDVNQGNADNAILKGDFDIKLPVVSLALLKQLIEIWYPLLSDHRISQFTFLNMLPGIDPAVEKKQIDKEKEESIKNSPLMNNTSNEFLNQQQNNEENKEEDDKTTDSNQ